MIKRYYIDTSVFSGYFDSEFEMTTIELFEQMDRQGINLPWLP